MRKLEFKSQERIFGIKAQQQFRRNPHQFAKRMLNEKQNRSPSFSKAVAENLFKEVNNDKKRSYKYQILKGIKRPPNQRSLSNLNHQVSQNEMLISRREEMTVFFEIIGTTPAGKT